MASIEEEQPKDKILNIREVIIFFFRKVEFSLDLKN